MRLFFSLLILLSFFSRATEPVQVFTDDLGRKVTVPELSLYTILISLFL